MLARTFKTAADLGLNEIEYEALVETLYRMESGKIKRSEICMRVFMEVATCGTIACIAGWANAIDPRAFPELQDRTMSCNLFERVPLELARVFGLQFYPSSLIGGESSMLDATPVQAVRCLRHYLETGVCNGGRITTT